MDNKEFNKLLSLWKKNKSSGIKSTGPQKGKDCLYFTEIEKYARGDTGKFTSTQKQHVHSCSYCQKMIAIFEKVMEEEEQVTFYEWLAEAWRNLVDTIVLSFKALPRLTPALAPVLAVILIFIIFSNQPLELKNYSFEFAQPTIKTRGFRSVPETTIEGKKFKISKIVATADCYAYLFIIKESKINLLIQEQIKGKIENTLPKEGWLEGEGKLILLLTRKPLQDVSSAGEIIIKNYDKDAKTASEALRRQLKRKDIGIKFLKVANNE